MACDAFGRIGYLPVEVTSGCAGAVVTERLTWPRSASVGHSEHVLARSWSVCRLLEVPVVEARPPGVVLVGEREGDGHGTHGPVCQP